MTSHPYGIKPSGGSYLEGAPPSCRGSGLGLLSCLADDKLLSLWEMFDAKDLGKVCQVSRVAYAISHLSDLWKALVLQKVSEDSSKTIELKLRSSWRTTYLATFHRSTTYKHEPLAISGHYSDFFYQPHLCANIPLKKRWLSKDTVDRRADLTLDDFRREYEVPNVPVIITDVVTKWPAFGKWNTEFWRDTHGSLVVHMAGIDLPMSDYLDYAQSTTDEAPLIVFDKRFGEKAPDLLQDFEVPLYFKDDLFDLLGSTRPDHKWLIMGPARSGSNFHVDPNRTSAWNAVLEGKKKWILFPPDCPPPGIHPGEDGLDVVAPVSLLEWFNNFYDSCHAKGRKGPRECIVSAGEVIFVPSGWWHCVLNLEWSVAITQNFVSEVTLQTVLRFLENNPHNVSGLPSHLRPGLRSRLVDAIMQSGSQEAKSIVQFEGTVHENIITKKRKATVAREVDKNNIGMNGNANSSNFSFDFNL